MLVCLVHDIIPASHTLSTSHQLVLLLLPCLLSARWLVDEAPEEDPQLQPPPHQQQQQQQGQQQHQQPEQQLEQEQGGRESPSAAAAADSDVGEAGLGGLELLRAYSLASDVEDSQADDTDQPDTPAAGSADGVMYGPQLPGPDVVQGQEAGWGTAADAAEAPMYGPQLPPMAVGLGTAERDTAGDAAVTAAGAEPAVVGAVTEPAAAAAVAAGEPAGAAGAGEANAAVYAIIDKLVAFMANHGASFEVGVF